jgi:hypothetical protein
MTYVDMITVYGGRLARYLGAPIYVGVTERVDRKVSDCGSFLLGALDIVRVSSDQ